MGKFDLSGAFKKACDTAKKASEKAAMAALIGAEKAQAGAKTLKETAKSSADKISESVKTANEQRKTDAEEKKAEKKSAAEKAAIEATGVTAIAPQNAVKIFYCLMTSDRKITSEEEETFNLIGKQLDSDFDAHKETIVNECKDYMEKTDDEEDYFDSVRYGIETALSEEQLSNNGYVTPKLLLWDLLTIAYSDDEYGKEEKELLKYVVRKLNISKDVFLEMESSILTVRDIEKEIAWIKGTDRPYLVIEKQIKELEKRRSDILFAIKALIML